MLPRSRSTTGYRFRVPLVLLTLLAIAIVPSSDQHAALAGSGSSISMPASLVVPTLDGKCDSTEYSDANQVQINIGNPFAVNKYALVVYMKRTTEDVYICFNLPLNPGYDKESAYTGVYIDRNNDGASGSLDDFAVIQPFHLESKAAYWNPQTSLYNGADPGNWSAVSDDALPIPGKEFSSYWHGTEYRIGRNILGGWQHTVGLSLFYERVRNNVEYFYGWPSDTGYAQPQMWGNANLLTDEIAIGDGGSIVPTLDGSCSRTSEWQDATAVTFPTAPGKAPAEARIKHTASDLYVCLILAIPDPGMQDGPNAAVYINRTGNGAELPGPDDMAFTISYNGTVRVNRGDGRGYTGPDPGGYQIRRQAFPEYGIWHAEYRISSAILGGGWNRDIDIAFAQQWLTYVGNDYGWPVAYRWNMPTTWAIGHLLGGSLVSPVDLQPTSIEVTQAIQDSSNSVVLVAGKRTYARVYATTNVSRSGVTMRLAGFRNGISLGYPLIPSNPGGAINLFPQSRRDVLYDSLYFELPESWIQAGSLMLRAEINPFHDIPENNYTNNKKETVVTFEQTNPLRLVLVNYKYTNKAGNLVSVSAEEQDAVESLLRRMYPVGTLLITRRDFTRQSSFGGMTLDMIPNPHGEPFDYVNADLANMLDSSSTLYYGLVGEVLQPISKNSTRYVTGKAGGIPSRVGSGSTWDAYSAPHEIGHMLNRLHAEFCGAPGGGYYPYPNGIIGGFSSDSMRFLGIDVGDAAQGISELHLLSGYNTYDIMTYCDSQWISDYTYTGLRDYIQQHFPVIEALNPLSLSVQPQAAVGDYLSIHGLIDTSTQTAALLSLARISQVQMIPPLVPGAYRIRLLSDTNSILADYPFTPALDSVSGTLRPFNQVVVYVPGTRLISIFSDSTGTEIGSAVVSMNAPLVTSVLQDKGTDIPATGPVNITWLGSDGDGDALTYTLLYSFNNGLSWRQIASTATNSFTIDASQLEGSSSAMSSRFRVIANDGVLTGFAESAVFRVAGKIPTAHIHSPANSSTYGYGQLTALEGSGEDFEDGALDDSRLSWHSSQDGFLGTGHLITPSLLSVGLHTITLTVTDSSGHSASASVAVNIGANLSMSGPTLGIAQSSFVFQANIFRGDPEPQMLSIRNIGSGSIEWSASSAAPWLRLQASTGSAPSDIRVIVDARDFLPGKDYSTEISIQSSNGSFVIPVKVQVEPAYLVFLPPVQR